MKDVFPFTVCRVCKICGQKYKCADVILKHFKVEELCNHGLVKRT